MLFGEEQGRSRRSAIPTNMKYKPTMSPPRLVFHILDKHYMSSPDLQFKKRHEPYQHHYKGLNRAIYKNHDECFEKVN